MARPLPVPAPYVEVARMDLRLHRRMWWRRVCRCCRDRWPCARRRQVEAVLGPPRTMRGWWLVFPALAGVLLVATAMAGVLPW
ncbi:MAG: hypothetical protein ACRDT6_18875 [Micromonosporaceae bacterium]